MPNFKKGDMFEAWGNPHSLFCITTNSVIRSDGRLVMGKGIAKQLLDRCSVTVARDAADAIGQFEDPERYGLAVVENEEQLIGLFQVKQHFKDGARLDLIEYSVEKLSEYCNNDEDIKEVNLNFPGIGYGWLTPEEVSPLLEPLPDYVNIWRF